MGWTFVDKDSVDSLITYGASWEDVDLSTKVPAGTNMVWLQVINTHASTNHQCSVRPNGSTMDRQGRLKATYTSYYLVALDANRIFDGYFASSDLNVYLIGYSDLGRTIASPYTSFALVGDGATYADIDLSSITGITLGFLETTKADTAYYNALRADGEAYDQYRYIGYQTSGFTSFLRLASGIGETKIQNSVTITYYLIGYSTTDGVCLAAPAVKTVGATGSWQEIDVFTECPAAKAVFVEIVNRHSAEQVILVKGIDDIFNTVTNVKTRNDGHYYAVVPIDRDGKFSAYVGSNTAVDFNILGYLPNDPVSVSMTSPFQLNVGLQNPGFATQSFIGKM